MKYFGIKTPERESEPSYIQWISDSTHNSWSAFFKYPNKDGDVNACRPPLMDAIRAYQAIGYKCVEISLAMVTDSNIAEITSKAVYEAVIAERERICKLLEQRAHLLGGLNSTSSFTADVLLGMCKQIRERGAK